jgi:ankyrin repeat protein
MAAAGLGSDEIDTRGAFATQPELISSIGALLAAGADPNLPDPDGISPLLIATENLHFDVAAFLLKKGASPNQWDWWGRTPLYAAVDMHTLPTGGRPDHLSLDGTTSLQMIELLLNAGANANAQLKLFPPFRSIGADRGADLMLNIGTSPLIRAAKAGDTVAIKLLLAHGANPSLPNSLGITPLMAAAGLGSDEIDTRGAFATQPELISSIGALLAAGADINVVDNKGQGALHGAAYCGRDDVVKYLVANHADLYAKDLRGFTPVDTALGKSDGHGRNGGQFIAHEQTAELLKQLMTSAPQAAGGAVPVRLARDQI